MSLPGFDNWLDNHGSPGIFEPTDDDLTGWREHNDHVDGDTDAELMDEYFDETCDEAPNGYL
jgi:hypothetical protein